MSRGAGAVLSLVLLGVRIDMLNELLDMVDQDAITGTTLADISLVARRGLVACPLTCDDFGFCDSDCDGWYDRVETANGANACDPLDPAFGPDPNIAAGICDPLASSGTGQPTSDDAKIKAKFRVVAQSRSLKGK